MTESVTVVGLIHIVGLQLAFTTAEITKMATSNGFVDQVVNLGLDTAVNQLSYFLRLKFLQFPVDLDNKLFCHHYEVKADSRVLQIVYLLITFLELTKEVKFYVRSLIERIFELE